MKQNKYEYVGSNGENYSNDMKPLYNMNGNSINGDNPYHTIEMMKEGISNASIFSYDQFINNVVVPSWLYVGPANTFYHDPINETWIVYAAMWCDGVASGENMYHLFV